MTPASPVPELTIALPAYEEGPNLELLLPRLHATAAGLHIPYEIIVVDTETPHDDTPAVCANYRTTFGRFANAAVPALERY